MRALALGLSLSISGIAQDPPAEARPVEAAADASAAAIKLGPTSLTMVLPPGCKPEKTPEGMLFHAVRPPDDESGIVINLAGGPTQLPKGLSRESIRREVVKAMKDAGVKYEFVEDGVRKVFEADAYWISGKVDEAGLEMRNLQVLVPCDPPMWLSFVTPLETWTKWAPTFDAALLTLEDTLRKRPPPPARKVGARWQVDVHGFSLELPSGWQLDTAPAPPGTVLAATGTAEGGSVPSLNVRAAEPQAKLDVAALSKQLKEQLTKALPNCKVEEAGAARLGNLACVRVKATHGAGGSDLRLFQYVVPGEPHSFIVSYTFAKRAAPAVARAIELSAATIKVAAPTPTKEPAAKPAKKG